MKKINFLTISIFLTFTIIYFTASIVLLGNQYRPLPTNLIVTRYIFILLGFSIITFIYFYRNGLTVFRFPSYLSIYLFIIWMLFSFSVTISELLHHSLPIQGLFFLVVVPFIYFTVMPFLSKIAGFHIHYSLFIANFAYVLISFLAIPIVFLPYSGIAANPNGFGQIGAIVVITGFFILISLSKNNIIGKLLVLTPLTLGLLAIILSSSRTSFIVAGLMTVLISLYSLTQRNFKPILLMLLVGVIGWFTPIKNMLLDGLIEKFSEFYSAGNLFNGRTGVWQEVFNEAILFGNGEDYFQSFFEGAHNSIIYILGVYGIVPAIFLTLFLLFSIILGFQHAFQRNRQKTAILPLIVVLTFILFSMTESMFGLVGNGITIAFYHVVGILIFQEKKPLEQPVTRSTTGWKQKVG
jgi:hypothetical protein